MIDTVDFDLGGVLGVRLLNARAREVAIVQRQLGPIEKPLAREPDITLRFVERLQGDTFLHHLGLQDVAFDDDEFLILRGKGKSRSRVEIPFCLLYTSPSPRDS